MLIILPLLLIGKPICFSSLSSIRIETIMAIPAKIFQTGKWIKIFFRISKIYYVKNILGAVI